MDLFLTWFLLVWALAIFVAVGGFGLASAREGERRAAGIGGGAAIVGAALLALGAVAAPMSLKAAAAIVLALGVLALLALLLWPMGRVARGPDVPQVRVDERDIMFARARLEPGSAEYTAYYQMRPENLEGDARTRTLPGIGSMKAVKANLLAFGAMNASFSLTEALRDEVDGPVGPDRSDLSPEAMTRYLKNVARYWGARTVGVTELQPYHVYSHIGRGAGTYGEPITLEHSHAIAFTVEMDFGMMGTSPDAFVSMESAREYVEAAKVALQFAWLIRSMGYPARAHIDGNYRVIAPLVARDAGLGEIGRMGLLMTPELGPRVRLGVVTTDLPLVSDHRATDTSVLDFCRLCEKCADNCPSKSIPHGDRALIDGALRWRINPDTCYRYWNSLGTDCGRCMTVCPYSHPDTVLHNVVREANRRSGFARRVAFRLDDVMYGSRPGQKPGPHWIRSISAKPGS